MSVEELICPDCGGYIGVKPGGDKKHCTCFSTSTTVTLPAIPVSDLPLTQPDESGNVSADASEKVCHACGKNLKGHRRLRHEKGYVCVSCAKAQQERELENTLACAECGRRVKAAGLVEYAGAMICRRCMEDHKTISKFKAPPPKLDGHDEAEKKRLLIYIGIAGLLGLILLLQQLGLLG
jgi:DNA-directed RNA polymerase subunit RPC12/RpoP